MDGLKLDKWKKNFNEGLGNIRIEFDAFFYIKKLEEYYQVKVDETSEELSLQLSSELPRDIKERLVQLLIDTKPEDSI